jgi:glucose/arabinose dehydrogenase
MAGRLRVVALVAGAALLGSGLLVASATTGTAAEVPISQGRPATASSTKPGFPAKNAVDGKPGTRWASARGGTQTLTVNLGSLSMLVSVRLSWHALCARAYRVEASVDKVAWTTIAKVTTGHGGTVDLPVSGSGRYVRVKMLTQCTNPPGPGYSLREFQVFGHAVDHQPPTPPGHLHTTSVGSTCVDLAWAPSTDNVGVVKYRVYSHGRVPIVETPDTHVTICGLMPATSYTFYVTALDAAGNESPPSNQLTVATHRGCGTQICVPTVVGTSTDIPWGLVTLPDGTILFTERDTFNLVHLNPVTHATTVVGHLPSVVTTNGEGGLTGLEISPTFTSDHWLYFFYSSATDNRISRIRYTTGALQNSTEQVLLKGIQRNHFRDGGRLRFGPDGKLYAGTGDAQNAANAQNLNSLNGKILRLNPDGTVPPDNPFHSYVWSYGHRNPQGLAFDSKGRLWASEFGDSTWDELNLIVKGGNYGWPACEGTSGSCTTPGFIAPVQTFKVAAASPSGIAIVHDVIFMAALRGICLYRMVIQGSTTTPPTRHFFGQFGRLRTVEPAPDGGLWLTTSNNDGLRVPRSNTIMHVPLG